MIIDDLEKDAAIVLMDSKGDLIEPDQKPALDQRSLASHRAQPRRRIRSKSARHFPHQRHPGGQPHRVHHGRTAGRQIHGAAIHPLPQCRSGHHRSDPQSDPRHFQGSDGERAAELSTSSIRMRGNFSRTAKPAFIPKPTKAPARKSYGGSTTCSPIRSCARCSPRPTRKLDHRQGDGRWQGHHHQQFEGHLGRRGRRVFRPLFRRAYRARRAAARRQAGGIQKSRATSTSTNASP